VLDSFVSSLKLANRGQLLNNFDLNNLSLPLEHSLIHNYWCIQSLQLQLNYHEKEEKFAQMIQANSATLLSRRSHFLNANIAQQLILAAFQLGPQSVHGSEKDEGEDEGEDKVLDKDRRDFEQQFKLTKGEEHQERRVKQ